MFKYVGKRNPEDSFDLTITVENDKGMVTPLKQIVRHSPTGMEWGYGGSGPADTALSILVDFLLRTKKDLTEKQAIKMVDRHYMDFKDKFIASADREGFELKDETIRQWLRWREM